MKDFRIPPGGQAVWLRKARAFWTREGAQVVDSPTQSRNCSAFRRGSEADLDAHVAVFQFRARGLLQQGLGGCRINAGGRRTGVFLKGGQLAVQGVVGLFDMVDQRQRVVFSAPSRMACSRAMDAWLICTAPRVA